MDGTQLTVDALVVPLGVLSHIGKIYNSLTVCRLLDHRSPADLLTVVYKAPVIAHFLTI